MKDTNKDNMVGERVIINNIKETFMENDNTFKYIQFIVIVSFLLLFFFYFLFVNNKHFYKLVKRIKYFYFYKFS